MLRRLKRRLVASLWRNHRNLLLNWKGLRYHAIRHDEAFLRLFMEVYSQDKALLTLREMYNLYRLARQSVGGEGDLAEVGVYKGGSARIICAVKGAKPLRLFDTFAGMPEVNQAVDKGFERGDFSDCSLQGVRHYLRDFPNVHFYQGRFPESARQVAEPPCWYCFVHLDVDIYESTLSGLEYFYPKLSRGGILVSHDYQHTSCQGVRRAFDEFLRDKPERAVELWDTQCALFKL